VPLSLTIVLGRPHWRKRLSSSRADTPTGDRSVGDQRETFPGAIVDHRQDPEAPTIGQLVVNEVEAPALVGGRSHLDRPPRSDRPLLQSERGSRAGELQPPLDISSIIRLSHEVSLCPIGWQCQLEHLDLSTVVRQTPYMALRKFIDYRISIPWVRRVAILAPSRYQPTSDSPT
jgi:hypothetical protein